jgi:hypothetical protein
MASIDRKNLDEQLNGGDRVGRAAWYFEAHAPALRLLLVAVDESKNGLDDLALLLSRELPNLLERTLNLTGRTGALGERLGLLEKEVLDPNTEHLRKAWKDVRPGR